MLLDGKRAVVLLRAVRERVALQHVELVRAATRCEEQPAGAVRPVRGELPDGLALPAGELPVVDATSFDAAAGRALRVRHGFQQDEPERCGFQWGALVRCAALELRCAALLLVRCARWHAGCHARSLLVRRAVRPLVHRVARSC